MIRNHNVSQKCTNDGKLQHKKNAHHKGPEKKYLEVILSNDIASHT